MLESRSDTQFQGTSYSFSLDFIFSSVDEIFQLIDQTNKFTANTQSKPSLLFKSFDWKIKTFWTLNEIAIRFRWTIFILPIQFLWYGFPWLLWARIIAFNLNDLSIKHSWIDNLISPEFQYSPTLIKRTNKNGRYLIYWIIGMTASVKLDQLVCTAFLFIQMKAFEYWGRLEFYW